MEKIEKIIEELRKKNDTASCWKNSENNELCSTVPNRYYCEDIHLGYTEALADVLSEIKKLKTLK